MSSWEAGTRKTALVLQLKAASGGSGDWERAWSDAGVRRTGQRRGWPWRVWFGPVVFENSRGVGFGWRCVAWFQARLAGGAGFHLAEQVAERRTERRLRWCRGGVVKGNAMEGNRGVVHRGWVPGDLFCLVADVDGGKERRCWVRVERWLPAEAQKMWWGG